MDFGYKLKMSSHRIQKGDRPRLYPRQNTKVLRWLTKADLVRVTHGVADPDFPDIPLGGWAGIVTKVDEQVREPLFLVEWNQSTLDNMPPIFHKRCDRDGLEETSSWLGNKDLEADVGDPVPIEQPTQIVTRPLDKGNQDDRIRAILGLTSDDPLPEANGENIA